MAQTRTKRLPFALFGAVVLSVISASVAEAARCHTTITFQNSHRRVPGPVDTECGTRREPLHSPPFGNWGVKSRYGNLRDSFQFAGWKSSDDSPWLQWNSCTSDSRYNTRQYLPHGQPQQAIPDGTNQYAMTVHYGPNNVPCNRVHSKGVYPFKSPLRMEIYELDNIFDFILFGNGADLVGSLIYPPINVPLTCRPSTGSCSGQSRWLSPDGNVSDSNVSANIRVVIKASYR